MHRTHVRHKFLALVLFALLFVTLHGSALADCVDYESHPHWIATMDSYAAATIEEWGSRVILCCNAGGLQIVDLSDPRDPNIVSHLLVSARQLEIVGGLGYVASAGDGLSIVSLASPHSPSVIGSIDTPGYANEVAVSGSYAYIADSSHGIRSVDISDPSNPLLLGYDWVAGSVARGLDIEGDYAFVAYDERGLQVADLSVPEAPVFVDQLNLPQDAQAIEVFDGIAFIAGDSNLFVADVSNPLYPVLLAELEMNWTFDAWTFMGDHLFWCSYTGSIRVIDVSDPSNPFIRTTLGILPSAGALGTMGDHLILHSPGWSRTDLIVVDLGDLETVDLTSRTEIPDYPHDLTAGDGFVYVVAGNRLSIVDNADPSAPVLRGTLQIAEEDLGAIVEREQHVYIGVDVEGIQIVDVSDPDFPELQGTFLEGESIGGMAIRGSYLYVGGLDTFYVIDIRDPGQPEVLGELSLAAVLEIDLEGGYAHVRDYYTGYNIIDVSNPAQPSLIASLELDINPYFGEIAVHDAHAFITSGFQTLLVIDATNPLDPFVAHTETVPTYVKAIDIQGRFAYMGGTAFSVLIYDISDPLAPMNVGNLDMEDCTTVSRIRADDEGIYLALGALGCSAVGLAPNHCAAAAGIAEFEPEQAFPPKLLLRPNPTRGRLRIDLDGDGSEPGTVSIFDASGRRMRTLVPDRRVLQPGAVVWDTRDEHGRPVPTGVYWVRITSSSAAESRPIVVLR